jgi:hypothetical protein
VCWEVFYECIIHVKNITLVTGNGKGSDML